MSGGGQIPLFKLVNINLLQEIVSQLAKNWECVTFLYLKSNYLLSKEEFQELSHCKCQAQQLAEIL